MPVTPYSAFNTKADSVKTKANNTELALARKLDARRQPCSGALAGFKGDIKDRQFLYDSKETTGNSIGVKKEDMLKITREANGCSRDPALILTIGNQQWVCVPMDVFKKMKGTSCL